MATPDLQHVWPEWTIEKQIGRGTFGTVWQAVRQSGDLTSRAAIKLISIPQDPYELEALRSDGLDLQASRTYLKRIVEDFVNEIRLMESFKGTQNIVSIEDYKVIERTDVLGWDIYIRMELLTPFSTYLCDRKMTQEDVIQLGCDICTALELCGRRNIIHRDIKPENIFVNSFGSFKLGDFGTARNMESLTGGLSQKGTFNYMAPEVVSGCDYDARVDVYSLGLVLYRLLNNNRLPFISEKQLLSPAERRNAFDRRIRGEQLPPPSGASENLAKVILKACAFRPEDRYENAAQMRTALQALPGTAAPAPQPQAAPKKPDDDPLPKVKAPAVTIEAPDMVISTPDDVRTRKRNPQKKPSAPRERGPWLRTFVAAALILVLFIGSGGLIYLYRSQPVSLSVTALPDKVRYQPGELLQTEGLMLTATCRDGSRRLIEDGFSCDVSRLDSLGNQAVTVTYRGNSTTFYVAVGQVPELSVATMPDKLVYSPGETLDTTGLTLSHWNHGDHEIITEGFTCWPNVITEPGYTEVSVFYGDKVTTFTVEVPKVVEISIASMPHQSTYQAGEYLNPDGLTLELTCSDGSRRIVSDGFSYWPHRLSKEGVNYITVTYDGIDTTMAILTYFVSEIRIHTEPSNTHYTPGNYLDTTGLVLEVFYTNGTSELISSGFSCQPSYMRAPGIQDITVTYRGATATFPVTIGSAGEQAAATNTHTNTNQADLSVCSISIASLPRKTVYAPGDPIDLTGLAIEVLYGDGSSEVITEGYTCTTQTLNSVGTHDITISYRGAKAVISLVAIEEYSDLLKDFSFDHLVVECSNSYSSDGLWGFNQQGELINWCLWIEFDMMETQSDMRDFAISCSWDEVINGDSRGMHEVDFFDAKNGTTYAEFAYVLAAENFNDKDRFAFMLMLPDDPSIEGDQTVTLRVGESTKQIHFTLIYRGDYDTGTGWAIVNLYYT